MSDTYTLKRLKNQGRQLRKSLPPGRFIGAFMLKMVSWIFQTECSPWECFSDSVKRKPNNRMLGRRQTTDSKQAGPYVWITYQEAYDAALEIGSARRSHGVNPVLFLGRPMWYIWIIAMEACNSQAVTYVPLYDTLVMTASLFSIHFEVLMQWNSSLTMPKFQ